MPVLINRSTGLAENLPDSAISETLAARTHDVPLYDPQGNPVNADHADAASLLAQGYTQPRPDELQAMLKHAHFNAPAEQAKTALEGAASAATFGASTAAERALGVKPEDIQGRREANPGMHTLGQVAGLTASALTGVGAASALEGAGAAIAERAAPILGETFIGRVGSQVAKAATENMMFQSGDEASKMFASDPHQSIETAASEIGLAGLAGGAIGGGLGATSELWKLGPGAKLNGLMNAIKSRTEGLPTEAAKTTGIEVPPEVMAALGDNVEAQTALQALMESNSSSGEKVRAALNQFHTDANNSLLTTIGKTPEDAAHVSEYDVGKEAQQKLVSAIEERVKPISEKYDKLEEKFKDAPLLMDAKAEASNKIAQLIVDNNLVKGPSEASLNLANKVMHQLEKQETAHDIRQYIKGLSDTAPFGSETYQTGKQLKNVLRDLQDSTIMSHLETKAPEVMGEFTANQNAYKQARELIDNLNDRLHVGKYGGPASFGTALREMAPEDVLKRLSPKGDVDMQRLLSEQFPEVADIAKAHEWNKLLKTAQGKEGFDVNATKLFNNIDKLSPEMKAFIMSPEQAQKLTAIQDLLKAIPKKMNTSGTARTLDKLWGTMPASAAGIGAMLTGHNPVAGFILGKIGQLVGREAPDAVRLAMLKFLGSSEATSAEGLRAAVQMAQATIKGENRLTKATKSIFEAGRDVVEQPSAAERAKIKKHVDIIIESPDDLMNVGGKTGHYLPDHGSALATITSRNLQYLATLKPNTAPLGVLDPERVASSTEESEYNNALDIAQNPLLVLKNVKDGTLTTKDMQHLHMMYPALAGRMSEKMNQQLIEAIHAGKTIPYKTKLSMSVFLGHSLDSSMSQMYIMSNQLPPPQQQMQSNPTKTGMQKLDKMPSMYSTPQQSREKRHLTSKP